MKDMHDFIYDVVHHLSGFFMYETWMIGGDDSSTLRFMLCRDGYTVYVDFGKQCVALMASPERLVDIVFDRFREAKLELDLYRCMYKHPEDCFA